MQIESKAAVQPSRTPRPERVSAEVFAIPLGEGNYCLYAPLRRAAVIVRGGAVDLLASLRDGTCGEPSPDLAPLAELFRRLELLDAGPDTRPITSANGAPAPTSATLFLTTACNLRCTYCYASAGELPQRSMSLAVAIEAIDYVSNNAAELGAKGFSLAYHGGGEPTTNWKTLVESLAHAKRVAVERGLALTASLATNGYLTDAQIDWIVAEMSGASVSFDGLPEVHDRHRLTIAGRGSSARVMSAMRRFDAAKFPYGVRVTVTHDQIERLPDSIEFIVDNFGCQRIQVEPAYQLGRWHEAPSAETAAFIAAYREAQSRARRRGRDITYSAARLDTLSNHFCGVTQDSFCLTPSGNVTGCYEVFAEENPQFERFAYGRRDGTGGYEFRLPVLDTLRAQSVDHKPYCSGCFAKWHCSGDCHHKAESLAPGEPFQGSDRCHITRELTKDQILDRIAEAGGIFWHERAPVHLQRGQGD
jgi:uncharacterized protein